MASNLWEYYSQQGQRLPSVAERRAMFNLGPSYRGTAAQNTALLARLQGGGGGSGGGAPAVGGGTSPAARVASASQSLLSRGPMPMPQQSKSLFNQGQYAILGQGGAQNLGQQAQQFGLEPSQYEKAVHESANQFIKDNFEQARKIEAETGVPAVLILAQAALESGYGSHAPGNNFFGIKGQGDAGSQQLWTTENVNGKDIRVQANFRKYSSPEAAFRDHARLLSTSPLYKNVMEATKSGDMRALANAIGKSPYATDPNYGDKIYKIMQENRMDTLYSAAQPKVAKPTVEPKKQETVTNPTLKEYLPYY